jgi:surfeit locus 1 family protein
MLAKLRAAGLVWPTLMTLIALPILAGLGTWQMQRKTWKEQLIARVKAGATAAPLPLADLMQGGVDATTEFRRVIVKGQFQHAGEFHVWAPGAKGPAWSIVTPLRLTAPIAPDRRYPTQFVLVIRGVVDDAHKASGSRPDGQVVQPVEIVGRVRLGGKPWFTTPDVPRNQWFAYDHRGMRGLLAEQMFAGSASGTADDAIGTIAPLFVEAESSVSPAPAPQPRLDTLNLSDRHFEYAMTWYALALTLIGVYSGFARARLMDLNDN